MQRSCTGLLNSVLTSLLISVLLLTSESNDFQAMKDLRAYEMLIDPRQREGRMEKVPQKSNRAMVMDEGRNDKIESIQNEKRTEHAASQKQARWQQYVGGIRHMFRMRVCYDIYGCFEKTYPWNSVWHILPQPPIQVNTKIYIYTKDKRNGTRIRPNEIQTIKVDNKKTVIIVHGWKSTYARSTWIRKMKDHFLKKGDFNVIGVYWGNGAAVNYLQAAGNSRLVGAQIAYLIERLHDHHRLSHDNIHLVGYSLGAQIAGFAGRRLRARGHSIARITGLDPAGPFFKGMPIIARLDSTDAAFVDVIYTSVLSGLARKTGHARFIVNRGLMQPGCGINVKCDHFRAVALFIGSIVTPSQYRAYKCNNYVLFRLGWCNNCDEIPCTFMGYGTSKAARGLFYVRTSRL